MIVAVPKETHPTERRVALVPAAVPPLVKAGIEVLVETQAGRAAGFSDEAYREKGARVVDSAEELFTADAVLRVRALGANPERARDEIQRMCSGQALVGFCDSTIRVVELASNESWESSNDQADNRFIR